MPPYRIEADEAQGIIRVLVTGRMDPAVAAAMITEARAQAARHKAPGILYDMRQFEPVDVTSAALFWMPRKVEALQGPQAARMRIAVLYPPRLAHMAESWENAFTNAGLTVKGFGDDEAAAIAWARAAARG